MFCNKCRRRVLFKKSKKEVDTTFSQYSITENFIIFYAKDPTLSQKNYINNVSKEKMVCPACKSEFKKNFKIKLGVSERIDVISQFEESQHPDHRPPYINAIPLIDIIRSVKSIKSSTINRKSQ